VARGSVPCRAVTGGRVPAGSLGAVRPQGAPCVMPGRGGRRGAPGTRALVGLGAGGRVAFRQVCGSARGGAVVGWRRPARSALTEGAALMEWRRGGAAAGCVGRAPAQAGGRAGGPPPPAGRGSAPGGPCGRFGVRASAWLPGRRVSHWVGCQSCAVHSIISVSSGPDSPVCLLASLPFLRYIGPDHQRAPPDAGSRGAGGAGVQVGA
jgi:hypothetical protein